MNTSKIISSALVVLASFSAAAAFAGGNVMSSDSAYPGAVAPGTSSLSRAEVRAALASAPQARLHISDNDYPAVQAANTGHKSRAEVRAELAQAPHGNAMLGSDSDYPAQAAGNAAGQPGYPVLTEAPKASGHVQSELIDSSYSGGMEKSQRA